jgi:hypothetical protein
MIKSAAIIKDKPVISGKDLRLQKKNLKSQQAKERKANKIYFPSPIDAPVVEVQNVPQDDSEPTRAELETKATELGIRFDGRTKDKKLGQLIQDRLTGE